MLIIQAAYFFYLQLEPNLHKPLPVEEHCDIDVPLLIIALQFYIPVLVLDQFFPAVLGDVIAREDGPRVLEAC